MISAASGVRCRAPERSAAIGAAQMIVQAKVRAS